ncbi:hypothetical protein K5D42_12815 [Pseudomonas cichorii]|nr:hypothetical protein [Pseudomonas cichorii]MBX8490738.1 hypothetical protein [Pseudomonas cichorii]
MDYVDAYRKVRPDFESLGKRLHGLLLDVANDIGVEAHAIEFRTKSLESFSEKITRPGKTYEDPLSEVTDLCGLRVILYYQEDVDKFSAALKRILVVDDFKSVDKKSELRSDQFGYMSVHLICQIDAERAKLLEWKLYKGFNVEIQIRTVLQHAWASISHALQYKSKVGVPDQFFRQLTRIAGLLELSDEQFSDLRDKTLALKSEVAESISNKDLDVVVNSVSLMQYIHSSNTVNQITVAALNAGFSESDERGNDQLGMVCASLGILKLSILDDLLGSFVKKAIPYFKYFASLSADEVELGYISGDSDHWCAIAIVALKYADVDFSFLIHESEWGEEYLRDVIFAAENYM